MKKAAGFSQILIPTYETTINEIINYTLEMKKTAGPSGRSD